MPLFPVRRNFIRMSLNATMRISISTDKLLCIFLLIFKSEFRIVLKMDVINSWHNPQVFIVTYMYFCWAPATIEYTVKGITYIKSS